MAKQYHHILRKFLLSLVGLGLVIAGYWGWRIYQSFRILQNIQDQQEQLSRYRQEAKQGPQDQEAWLRFGDAAFNFWQNAGRGIRIAKEVNQTSLVWQWLGQRSSALKEANLAYSRVLKLAPESTEAVVGLCRVLIEQFEPAKAVMMCQRAVQSSPAQSELYLALSTALIQDSQWAKAEVAARQAIAIESNDDDDAYYQLGNALLGQEKVDEGIVALQKSISLDPNANLAYIRLGDALEWKNRSEEAISAYRQSIKVAPSYPLAYERLGQIYSKQKRWEDAVLVYREGLEYFPNEVDSLKGLGNALVELQQWEEALAAYETVLLLDPEDEESRQIRERIIQRQKVKPTSP